MKIKDKILYLYYKNNNSYTTLKCAIFLVVNFCKGNPDWNFSAPHGAGRIMSRNKAKEMISIDDFRNSMKGIFSTSVSEDTIDESPMVYKNTQEIVECIKDTVEITDMIKPVYNFKAS